MYHGLVIPDEIPHPDVEDTHFSPLPTHTQPTIADNSFYPTAEHDSFNHGGESAIIEDSYNHEYVVEPAEQKLGMYTQNKNRLGAITYKMPPITPS